MHFLQQELKSNKEIMKSVTDIQSIILDTLPNQKENTKNETQTPIAQVLHKIQYQEKQVTITILFIKNSNTNSNFFKVLKLPKEAIPVNKSLILNTLVSSMLENYLRI